LRARIFTLGKAAFALFLFLPGASLFPRLVDCALDDSDAASGPLLDVMDQLFQVDLVDRGLRI
jgi:hypothetical protein